MSNKGRQSQVEHNRRYRAIKRGELKPHEYTMTLKEALESAGLVSE